MNILLQFLLFVSLQSHYKVEFGHERTCCSFCNRKSVVPINFQWKIKQRLLFYQMFLLKLHEKNEMCLYYLCSKMFLFFRKYDNLKIVIVLFKSFMMIMLSAWYMNMISLIQVININCLVTSNITSLLMNILTQLPREIKCYPGRMGEDC